MVKVRSFDLQCKTEKERRRKKERERERETEREKEAFKNEKKNSIRKKYKQDNDMKSSYGVPVNNISSPTASRFAKILALDPATEIVSAVKAGELDVNVKSWLYRLLLPLSALRTMGGNDLRSPRYLGWHPSVLHPFELQRKFL
jgi:hypothetical protein